MLVERLLQLLTWNVHFTYLDICPKVCIGHLWISVFMESSNIRNLFWTFSKSRLPCWQRIEYCFVFDWIVSFTISNSCYERRLWYSQWGPSSNSERVTRSSCSLFGKTRIQETGLGRDHRSRTPIWFGSPGKITKASKFISNKHFYSSANSIKLFKSQQKLTLWRNGDRSQIWQLRNVNSNWLQKHSEKLKIMVDSFSLRPQAEIKPLFNI